MFFIGATGQLLTLLLTVTLPFMFLVSGHQKIDVISSKQHIKIELQNKQEFSVENHSNISVIDFYIEKINIPVLFKKRIGTKCPHKNIGVKWRVFYLNTSGNKAPPVQY